MSHYNRQCVEKKMAKTICDDDGHYEVTLMIMRVKLYYVFASRRGFLCKHFLLEHLPIVERVLSRPLRWTTVFQLSEWWTSRLSRKPLNYRTKIFSWVRETIPAAAYTALDRYRLFVRVKWKNTKLLMR